MFLGEDARSERFGIVARLDAHLGLAEDRARIELLGHDVHRAARDHVPRDERAPMRVEPLVLGQQRGVDVDDPAPPARDEIVR